MWCRLRHANQANNSCLLFKLSIPFYLFRCLLLLNFLITIWWFDNFARHFSHVKCLFIWVSVGKQFYSIFERLQLVRKLLKIFKLNVSDLNQGLHSTLSKVLFEMSIKQSNELNRTEWFGSMVLIALIIRNLFLPHKMSNQVQVCIK